MVKMREFNVTYLYADGRECYATVTARSLHTAVVKAAERMPLSAEMIGVNVELAEEFDAKEGE